MMRIKDFALATILAIGLLVPAWSEPLLPSRSELLDAARGEILSRSAIAVAPASLGDWKTVADAACFALFRKTELFRGPMRLIAVSSREIGITLYPEGTLIVTTGLFDYADDRIFERDALSPRRMRNISAEREELIAPFIAEEAARFALDHCMKAWERTSSDPVSGEGEPFSARVRPTPQDTLEADRLAAVLMSVASYPKRSYESWLSGLADEVKSATPPDNAIGRYLSRYPDISDRLDSLISSSEDIEKTETELTGVLAGIRTSTALKESLSSVEALREIHPSSPYLARLEAFARHELWLSDIAPADAVLKTILPIARQTEYYPGAETWYTKAAGVNPGNLPDRRSTPPGNPAQYELAVDAYRRALSSSPDPTLESAYATLLAYSGIRESRAEAVRTAAEAATSETGGVSFVARVNYASILFLTGIDRLRAITVLERLAGGPGLEASDVSLIPSGMAGDGRDAFLNLALMYRLSGHTAKASNEIAKLTAPGGGSDSPRISWRRVRIGDPADELTARWGEPDEISYSYYTESWSYPRLSARVSVADGPRGREVKAIRIGPDSPLSPGADIRVGDTRADFEAAFGKPVWYADDAAVYRKGKDSLAVEYLGGRIRGILAWSE